jgi:transcriptional regulator GlxA family with amidase domain
MKRRDLLKSAAAFGCVAAIPLSSFGQLVSSGASDATRPTGEPSPLKPPAEGSIPVAFVISDGAVMIDFAGPWEVFQDAYIHGGMGEGMRMDLFRLYTVAETDKPIEASGGMKIVPDYTFATALAPKVIVVPGQSAQNKPSQAMQEWIRKSAKTADVTMSVCTGAFLLANTGLLQGKAATTNHNAYKSMAMQFPDITLKRGARFVEQGNVATAGGLSSGIDLALRVVERYYGHDIAKQTAYDMEYQGQGWMDPGSNEVYAKVRVSTDAHPLCAVCDMDVDRASAPKSVYKGKTYYFCMADHKQLFDVAPEKYLS